MNSGPSAEGDGSVNELSSTNDVEGPNDRLANGESFAKKPSSKSVPGKHTSILKPSGPYKKRKVTLRQQDSDLSLAEIASMNMESNVRLTKVHSSSSSSGSVISSSSQQQEEGNRSTKAAASNIVFDFDISIPSTKKSVRQSKRVTVASVPSFDEGKARITIQVEEISEEGTIDTVPEDDDISVDEQRRSRSASIRKLMDQSKLPKYRPDTTTSTTTTTRKSAMRQSTSMADSSVKPKTSVRTSVHWLESGPLQRSASSSSASMNSSKDSYKGSSSRLQAPARRRSQVSCRSNVSHRSNHSNRSGDSKRRKSRRNSRHSRREKSIFEAVSSSLSYFREFSLCGISCAEGYSRRSELEIELMQSEPRRVLRE